MKKRITYKGRDSRPTRKTHAGVQERYVTVGILGIQKACDDFLKSRGLPLGYGTIQYGKGES